MGSCRCLSTCGLLALPARDETAAQAVHLATDVRISRSDTVDCGLEGLAQVVLEGT